MKCCGRDQESWRSWRNPATPGKAEQQDDRERGDDLLLAQPAKGMPQWPNLPAAALDCIAMPRYFPPIGDPTPRAAGRPDGHLFAAQISAESMFL